jgi:hypothetical protein
MGLLALRVSAGAWAGDRRLMQIKDDRSTASLQETAQWLVDAMSRCG